MRKARNWESFDQLKVERNEVKCWHVRDSLWENETILVSLVGQESLQTQENNKAPFITQKMNNIAYKNK